jgi:hypothetical protein
MDLDEIRNAVSEKYSAYELTVNGKDVALLNPLRLPKERRAKLMKLQEEMKQEGADQASLLEQALSTVANTRANGEHLIKAIGGDLAMLVEVFTRYGKHCQVGEA